MPTFDGGHCFLTVLIPISTSHAVDAGGMLSSPVHMVREQLSILPTARQSPATLTANSPFARNDKTHFARFAIIDDVVFNGRVPHNAILNRASPSIPQTVDRLNCPYLMFVADFDAPRGDPAELEAYLGEVWTQMADQLEPIFKHCHDFAGNVNDSRSFVAYITRHQIETTMPFNDYWIGAPPLESPSLRLVGAGLLASFIVLWAILYLACRGLGLIVGAPAARGAFWSFAWPWLHCIELLALALVAAALVLLAAYKLLMARAAKPFPVAPNSDLRSILKALYLQRAFTRFAIAAQTLDVADLHAAFGRFLAEHRPEDLKAPTQARGTIPQAGPTR